MGDYEPTNEPLVSSGSTKRRGRSSETANGGAGNAESKNAREAQLIELATGLFSQGGFRETSLQEIADKLGITRPLFYYYFESKEELLWRLIGNVGDQLKERARPIAESEGTPEEKLRRLLETHADTLLGNRDTFRVYFAERHLVEGKRNRQLKRGEDEYIDLIAAVIGDGQRSEVFRRGNRRVLALISTGVVNSLLRWYEPSGAIGVEEIGRLAADIATQGLLSPASVVSTS